MRNVKIVADSSANILTLSNTPFAAAPLKIITEEKEFIDNASLDAPAMVDWFATYNGRSQTSCPNPSDWLEAFGDADEVYCITITSGLSGSYNAACIAKQMYEENGDKRVCVIDSLSAGPELMLLVEKLEEYLEQDMPYEQICEQIEAYKQTTGLVFMLESLKNFAANGRVSPTIAKLAGVLGIRVVGKASDQGKLEPLSKCRGEAKSLATLVSAMQSAGLVNGKVRIAHCCNETAANLLVDLMQTAIPRAEVSVHRCLGLCSYYAEKGGLLIGFEKQ